MINWNEVKVGETEITDQYTQIRRLVKGRDGGYVWAMDVNGVHAGCCYSWAEDGYRNWTIYDPWEEITDQCRWYRAECSSTCWEIWYKDTRITHEARDFKADGRRVWKRKEG